MNELIHILNSLTAREKMIGDEVSSRQRELDQLRVQREAVETTMGLLKQQTTALPLNGTARYKKQELGVAVLDCVNNFGGETGITRPEIVKILAEHGFNYKGKPANFYSSVSITANRLHKEKKLIRCIESGDTKRFAPIQTSAEITGAASGAAGGDGHHSQ